MGILAKAGLILAVPIDKDRWGLGLVAAKRQSELLVFMYDAVIEGATAPEDLSSRTPLLGSSSLDAKIWHGDWKILGQTEEKFDDFQPIYKIETIDGWVAESFDMNLRLPIDERTAKKLRFRKCVAPIRLERALKAHFGFGEWKPAHDDLLFVNITESRKVISDLLR